jgi:predicted nucleotidyltransferase
MSKNQAKIIAGQYASLLKKNKFPLTEVYLFGSHAIGKANKNSDIDVAIVTNKNLHKSYLADKMKLWEFAVQIDSRIEPILLHKTDLIQTNESIMGREVKKHGIKVN